MIKMLIKVAGAEHRPALRRLVYGLVAEGLLIGLGLVTLLPFLSALMTEDYRAALMWWSALAAFFVLYGVVRVRTQLLGYVSSIELGRALYARLGAHIAKLPLGWFSEQRTGELAVMSSRGVIEIVSGVAHLLRPVVVMSTTPLVILVAMAFADWQLALSVAIAVPFSMLAVAWTKKLTSKADDRLHAASVETAARIVEFAQAQPVLRAFARGASAAKDLDLAFVEQRQAGRAQLEHVIAGLVAVTMVIQAALTLLLILGVNRALGGSIDVPELAALLVLGLRFAEPLLGAADLQSAMRMSEETLTRMDALLQEPPLPDPETPKTPRHHEIKLDDVHFDYGGATVLQGVSFTAPANGLTALVGPSGAGKTTILRLIARFFDVTVGRVTIGDVDVRAMEGDALLADLAIVFQDVYLFDGTIADNLKIGKPDATDADVMAAIEIAQLSSTIDRLPAGLETPVGEGGAALSGGERQRVSIARAHLKGARIVLLDEATAALDALDEARMREAITAMARDRTVIAVAHRLSTVRAADQIVFLEDGRVAEKGRHAELISLDGRYAQFWNLHVSKTDPVLSEQRKTRDA